VTPAELESLFQSQQQTALRWRISSASERRDRIRRLRDAVMSRRDEFYAAAKADFRKPPAEVDMTELLPVISEANHAVRALGRWMRPKGVWPTLAMIGTSSRVEYQPRGRCLILSPWNYPVNLSLGPLVSALAAGNTAIIKPSEMSPHLSAVMGELIESCFSPNEVAMVQGAVDVSRALLELPFDHIFFTGSTAVGKQVMAAASKHLTSVTLELGGKSPTIVDASANLDAAVDTLCWAKFTNAGQTCIAPDHIYVHDAVFDRFVERCRSWLTKAYGTEGAERQASPDLARIVNARHYQRLTGLLDEARALGSTVLEGGQTHEESNYIAPTLLTGAPEHANISEQEIFGPLLPLIRFRSVDEVIARINAQPKPLALYIWARHSPTIEALRRRTSSGGVCINQAVVQFAHGNLPFGGVNASGLGNSHGWYGFRAFSHERAVLRGRINLVKLFYPPFTALTRRLSALLLRIS